MNQTKLFNFYKIFINIILIINQITSKVVEDDNGELQEKILEDDEVQSQLEYIQLYTESYTRQGCEIPNYANSTYKILNDREATYQPGDRVPEYSILELTCAEGYKLPPFAKKDAHCINGNWSSLLQPCLGELQEKILEDNNVLLKLAYIQLYTEFYTHQGCEIPNYSNSAYKIRNDRKATYQPGDRVPENSILEVTCDKGYKLPAFAQNNAHCINGKWSNLPQPCLLVREKNIHESDPDYQDDRDDKDDRDYENTDYGQPYPESNTHQGCEIPNHSGSVYKIFSDRKETYQLGDHIPEFSILEITCDEGYKLPPFAQNNAHCIHGKWNNLPQACLRICPSLMSTQSTTVECTYEGSTTSDNCLNPVNGTMVHLSCNEFYEIDPAVKRNPIRICRDGSWFPNLPECYATCGLKNYQDKFQSLTGEIATPGNHPWYAGVYTNTMEFRCSGTIIDQNIVISAAHCFCDHNDNLLPVENFIIAAGKYYRGYDDDRDTFAQYSKVLKIFIPPEYKSIDGFYSNDIAVVILEYSFGLDSGVLPACINLNKRSEYAEHFKNSNGIFINWAYTQEYQGSSDVLTERKISYVPLNKCYKEVSDDSAEYILFDKLCGGKNKPYQAFPILKLDLNFSEPSMCHSNSGSGLVNNVNGRQHNVIGILSTYLVSTESGTTECISDQYGLYTFVSTHSNFIQKLVTMYGWTESIVQPNGKLGNSPPQAIKCERCVCDNSVPAEISVAANKSQNRWKPSIVPPEPEHRKIGAQSVECDGDNCTRSNQYPILLSRGINVSSSKLRCVNQTLKSSKEGIYTGSSRVTYFDFQLLQMFSGNDEDYVISPARIRLTLAMLLEGSQGDTASEISKVSKIPLDVNSTRGTLNKLQKNLKIDPEDTILKLANLFVVSDKYTVRQEYSNILQDHYNQRTTPVGFRNYEELTSIINNQTSAFTVGLIPNIIRAENINEQDSMIISNALFFTAQWKIKFTDAQSTIVFSQTNSSKREGLVDTLQVQSQFKYRFLEELNAQAVELPYSDGEHAMLILLPKENYKVDDLQREMQYINFNTIVDSLVTTEVNVSLPKFEIQTNTNLGPILEGMGIKALFSRNSNLSGIFEDGEVKVSKILHTVRLIVDKKGIRYPAPTEASIDKSTDSRVESVIAHRPFLFFIYNMFSNNILFEGRVNSPFSNQVKFCKYWNEILI